MASRVPPEALAFYLGLGSKRSYEAVAEHFGVSKTAVTNRAVQENWQARVEETERKARETSEAKALESLEEMTARHIKIVRAIQARAYEALRSMPIHSASAAVRALVESVKLECLLRGQPSERSAVTVEDTIRKEYARWFGPEEGDAGDKNTETRATEGGKVESDEDDDTEA